MASIQKYDTKKGPRYRVDIYAGVDPLTGKQVNMTKRGFTTKKAANAWADRTRVEIQQKGLNSSLAPDTITNIANAWLIEYKPTVRDATYIKTRGYVKNHIIPLLGDIKVNKITPFICQEAANKWSTDLVNYKEIFQYFKRILKYAVNLNMISHNPAEEITLPKAQIKIEDTIKVWSKEELSAFLEACKADNKPACYPFFRLLAFTGMRRGEILALEWRHLDLDKRYLKVEQAVTKDANNSAAIGPPKNKKSKRIITLDKETVDILKNWKDAELSQKYVFESSPGHFMSENRPRNWLQNICRKNHIQPIRIHDIRHTHCTLLMEAGMSPKDVQDRLGHQSIEMTLNVYAHVTAKRQKHIADSFGNFMSSTSKTTS
ncbi:MAG: tyrosine-type recombinase/integrase [Clostridia bacterium]|nr:tyrosine-type recombinase/integrase [Clostridiales bacterium]MDU7504719.1 tyrosine-type recombinase/integrase [Clostridia bacterium]